MRMSDAPQACQSTEGSTRVQRIIRLFDTLLEPTPSAAATPTAYHAAAFAVVVASLCRRDVCRMTTTVHIPPTSRSNAAATQPPLGLVYWEQCAARVGALARAFDGLEDGSTDAELHACALLVRSCYACLTMLPVAGDATDGWADALLRHVDYDRIKAVLDKMLTSVAAPNSRLGRVFSESTDIACVAAAATLVAAASVTTNATPRYERNPRFIPETTCIVLLHMFRLNLHRLLVLV